MLFRQVARGVMPAQTGFAWHENLFYSSIDWCLTDDRNFIAKILKLPHRSHCELGRKRGQKNKSIQRINDFPITNSFYSS